MTDPMLVVLTFVFTLVRLRSYVYNLAGDNRSALVGILEMNANDRSPWKSSHGDTLVRWFKEHYCDTLSL